MMRRIAFVLALGAVIATGQMEKRSDDLYDLEALRTAAPAVGTQSTDLAFAGIDGRMWSLSSFRGKVLVIVKGGYT